MPVLAHLGLLTQPCIAGSYAQNKRLQLKEALEEHRSVSLDLDVCAPSVVLPASVAEPVATALVLDLGRLRVRTGALARTLLGRERQRPRVASPARGGGDKAGAAARLPLVVDVVGNGTLPRFARNATPLPHTCALAERRCYDYYHADGSGLSVFIANLHAPAEASAPSARVVPQRSASAHAHCRRACTEAVRALAHTGTLYGARA